MHRRLCLLALTALALSASGADDPHIPPAATGAKGLDTAINKLHAPTRGTPALSPAQSLAKLKPAPGIAVDLVASEPVIRQPLCINFDARGRMWVTQYVQYPIPAGLRVVEYDNYLRAKFDRVPPPPPRRTPGKDRVTILEDVKGDGSFAKATVFLDDLNIATSALPDRDGVWVMNPPYLLFYPDANHDDVPDGPPVVHLSGFGLEDTHSVASSLTFGPDGWIYGASGSTTTCKVKVDASGDPRTTDYLGQCVWRYHPTRHTFEVFAEGGGNTFGVAFDPEGRLFSGTNWNNFRGLHFVQGGYYLKNWGKHGPLTNPYAFGNFEHMPHTGNAQRLTHTFAVYDGGLLPAHYDGALIGPNALMSRVQVSRLVPDGSTYKTVEGAPLLESDDGWFRPVDAKVGPDGAVYVADFYEDRISHVDPRDNWDRTTGRIYRLRPVDWKPGLKPFDLTTASNESLLAMLDHANGWYRDNARRVLAARSDAATFTPLLAKVDAGGRAGMAALWALHEMGQTPARTLIRLAADAADPAIRSWAVRFIGDGVLVLPGQESPAKVLARRAAEEPDGQVRSQLASTAKRLDDADALQIIESLWSHDADAADPHLPLLIWWALESKAVSQRDAILAAFTTSEPWGHAIVKQTIVRRLAHRWAAQPAVENQHALLTFLDHAPDAESRSLIFAGIADAFEGRQIRDLLPDLTRALAHSGELELALRAGDPAAHDQALKLVATEDAALAAKRVRLLELLAQLGRPADADAVLAVVEQSKTASVRKAAIGALGRLDAPAVGPRLVALYPKLITSAERAVRAAILHTLADRPASARALLAAIDAGSIPRADVTFDVLDRLRRMDDPAVAGALEKSFGRPKQSSSEEKQTEIARLKAIVTAGPKGDADAGHKLFTARCAACHTLFGEGGKIGPDLTPYDRSDLNFLLLNVVDPSLYVREEFTNFRVKTTDGRALEGLIIERAEGQLTLIDQTGQSTIVPRDQVKDERALPTSIMPEDLLTGLPDPDLRDLFAYLMKPAPSKKK